MTIVTILKEPRILEFAAVWQCAGRRSSRRVRFRRGFWTSKKNPTQRETDYAVAFGRRFPFCVGTATKSLMSSSTMTTPSILFSSVR